MIRSMTGYGRGQKLTNGMDILVEIKSVNNRFYDFSSRLPRNYAFLEEKLKKFLQGSVYRGKVDVFVSINILENKNEVIAVNTEIAEQYINALRRANENLKLDDDIKLSNILKFPDVFSVIKEADDEDAVWNAVVKPTEEALEKFVVMRETEGARIKEDLSGKLDYIYSRVAEVENRFPDIINNYRERLYNKLKDVLSDNNIDEQRILTEAAVFSEKVATDEETVRLKSHIKQFRSLLDSEAAEPVGRKLDFIVQEMNREANTIGSKCQDIETSEIVVDIKSEIEKIREQIQNIE